MVWIYAKENLTVLGDAEKGGQLRFFTQFVERIPIPRAPDSERSAISALVEKCLSARGQGAGIAEWEAEMNECVARLYGLTPEEIKIVEGSAK